MLSTGGHWPLLAMNSAMARYDFVVIPAVIP